MNPKQAWYKECRWCSNTTPKKCETAICKLSDLFEFPSTLQRIKAHRIDCNGEDHPKECNGKLIRPNGTDGNICFLHPFRLGKNPTRKKRTPNPAFLEKGREALKKYREAQASGATFPP